MTITTITREFVADIEVGDEIVNVGFVVGVERVGIFFVMTVRGTIWCLGTGKGEIATWDVVRHQSETVTVRHTS